MSVVGEVKWRSEDPRRKTPWDMGRMNEIRDWRSEGWQKKIVIQRNVGCKSW